MDIFLLIFSYLIGSIPFGLVFGKWAGVDVRSAGSKNIGATNVTRLAGKKLGVLTLVCDASKGAVPMFIARFLGADLDIVMGCGAAAFTGHCFPVYLRFAGGKGVATALGVFLFLDRSAVVAGVAMFVLLVWSTGYVSLGSIFATLTVTVVIWWLHGAGPLLYLAAFVTVLVIAKHYENIGRLFRGEEKSIRKK
jgi:glycerol-3-phosphate acyltransferase PlsY